MNREAALDQIRVVVEKVLNRDMSHLDADTRLFEELNVDSTGILEILMELEDSVGFEVDIDSLDPSTFQTAGSLADYIAQMTAEG
jgi:acyl carrier protein